MAPRLALQQLFESFTGPKKVYFQPPENIKLEYPCIVYKRDAEEPEFADNNPYLRTKRYLVTVIDQNPDSLIPDKIGNLRLCRFVRHFVVDNLNHDIFTLYF